MTEAKIYVPTTDAKTPPRTYNQLHQPRKFADGRRRVSVYVCWSFPGEANRDIRDLDNRFSTMTEVRRVEWPFWETPEWSDPTITTTRGSAHYQVNALGFASNVVLPARGMSLGLKYFKEFSNRSTFEGYTVKIAGAVTF